jgi:hypothetical protein
VTRIVRCVLWSSLLLFAWASVADARGGMGGGMGGGKRGSNKKGARGAAQGDQLIQDAFRRDVLTRERYTGW